MTRVLAIYRAERFSPNSVERDKAILDAAGGRLQRLGFDVDYVGERSLTRDMDADVFLTMGRESLTADILEARAERGAVVINTPAAIRACARDTVDGIMRAAGIPAAPLEGVSGYWIKRGDEAAQCPGDVRYAACAEERDRIMADFRRRGVERVVVTAHVEGDLVKFYGVRGTSFFRYFYPTDDGCHKFSDELVNGKARHYGFSTDSLHHDAEQLARLVGTDIYGGDCIVRSDGSHAIIDFNDFPSFSRCRNEAAEAIAGLVARRVPCGKLNMI